MGRVLNSKELTNTKLATNYGGWIYCNECNENIGYLCYSTYDNLQLNYKCSCGSEGSANLDFKDSKVGSQSKMEFTIIKNRLCCPEDESPLITLLDKKLVSYELTITCRNCNKTYKRETAKVIGK